MGWRAATCAFGLLLVGSCGGAPEEAEAAVVDRVLDGDTVEVEGGRRVRYLLVDAPEIAHASGERAQCFGDEARAANEGMVGGTAVLLEYDAEREDAYGRTLAYLWLGERMVNEVLVERGYARVAHIPPNGRHLERLRAAEEAARDARAGLWGACP